MRTAQDINGVVGTYDLVREKWWEQDRKRRIKAQRGKKKPLKTRVVVFEQPSKKQRRYRTN